MVYCCSQRFVSLTLNIFLGHIYESKIIFHYQRIATAATLLLNVDQRWGTSSAKSYRITIKSPQPLMVIFEETLKLTKPNRTFVSITDLFRHLVGLGVSLIFKPCCASLHHYYRHFCRKNNERDLSSINLSLMYTNIVFASWGACIFVMPRIYPQCKPIRRFKYIKEPCGPSYCKCLAALRKLFTYTYILYIISFYWRK